MMKNEACGYVNLAMICG